MSKDKREHKSMYYTDWILVLKNKQVIVIKDVLVTGDSDNKQEIMKDDFYFKKATKRFTKTERLNVTVKDIIFKQLVGYTNY